jgi:hypothetical protein
VTTPTPDVRETAARALFADDWRGEADWLDLRVGEREQYLGRADAVLSAVTPVTDALLAEKIAKNLDQIAESYNPAFTPPEYAQEVAVKRLRREAFKRAAEVARSYAQPRVEQS